jgi:hypothetical protein
VTRKKEQVKETVVSFVRRVRLQEKTCEICGKKFMGIKKSKYCGRVCQNKAFYQSHGGELREQRRESYRRQKAKAAKG